MAMQISVEEHFVSVSPEVSEYLDLLQTALKLGSRAEVVGRLVVQSFSDDIRKHPEMRPKSIRAEIAKLEEQAAQLFDGCAATGLVEVK